MNDFFRGLRAGVPIGLGYISVSFSFGILAVSLGLEWWQALLISMTTLTSAGQLSGVVMMINPAQYMQMLISQLVVNMRYSFMSVSLSQKTDSDFRGIKRWLLGFFITDEIFAVAINEEKITASFFGGLSVFPYIGWACGTLFGALLGNVLPERLMGALCLAIYGMFVAIVVPKAKKSGSLLIVVAISIAVSCAFFYIPIIRNVSGLSVSISAIVAALVGAIFFPIKEEYAND